MSRVLVIPAAGRGSRLGRDEPKALVPVAGRPMLAHLLRLHAASVDRVVVVVAPAALEAFRAFAAQEQAVIDLEIQAAPTGMLDAILAAAPSIERLSPDRVAITWCDQVALTDRTISHLAARALADDAPAMVFPTAVVEHPYIHFDRHADGRISGVRQRREGDAMPVRGETDMGLFDLSIDAYRALPAYARARRAGARTGEINFLPFIPALAAGQTVETFPGVDPIETVGINTPEELARIEAHLRRSRPMTT